MICLPALDLLSGQLRIFCLPLSKRGLLKTAKNLLSVNQSNAGDRLDCRPLDIGIGLVHEFLIELQTIGTADSSRVGNRKHSEYWIFRESHLFDYIASRQIFINVFHIGPSFIGRTLGKTILQRFVDDDV